MSSIMNIQLNQRNETSKLHTDCALQHDVLVAFEMSVTVVITHAHVELKDRKVSFALSFRATHYGKPPI